MSFLAVGLESSSELAHDVSGVPLWAYPVLFTVALSVGLPLWNAIAPPEIKDEMRQLKQYQRRDILEIKEVHSRQKFLLDQQKLVYKRSKREFRRRQGVHRWEPLHRKTS